MDIKSDLVNISSDVRFNEPMSKHTSFKIGGAADILCVPENIDEILRLVEYFKKNSIKFMIIGNGSNLLVSDLGVEGAVIKIGSKMSGIEIVGEEMIIQSGALLSKVANEALKNSLTGLEAISGIPGTIGGAIYMNAGAYGTEIKDVIKEATFIDENGEIKTYSQNELELGYRKSIFSDKNNIILSCVLKLKKADKNEISNAMKEYTKQRTQKQPLNYPSAGSTFKRPEGYFAAKLIEDCGLKGYSIGGAKISELHSGFIINFNNAKAKDVLDLIEYTKQKVFEKFGVKIEPEVKIIGRR